MKPLKVNRKTKQDAQFISSLRLGRWISVAIVITTFPLSSPHAPLIFTLFMAVAASNILWQIRAINQRVSPLLTLIGLLTDYISAAILILVSGGLSSPYYVLLLILAVGTIARYGLRGLAHTVAIQSAIAGLIWVLNIPSIPVPDSSASRLVIVLLSVVAMSLLAERMVRSQDEEIELELSYSHRMQNERERLLALINSLDSAVLAVDPNGIIYLHNAAALELLDTNRNIEGVNVADILPLEDESGKKILMETLVTSPTRQSHTDYGYRASDDTIIDLDLTVSPVHMTNLSSSLYDTGGSMLVMRDITKKKSLDEQRDEFIAVTSHELRTPLAIAEANLSTAMLPGYGKIDQKAMKLLVQAHQNVIFLGQIIQDSTNLSRAEREDYIFERKLVDLSELVKQIGQDYVASAEKKGLKLNVAVPSGKYIAYSSQHEIQEVIQNFITNAIKYTQTGSVSLALGRHDKTIFISVKDTGIGISASDRKRVFEKFYRSEDYRTRATGGTGLGLYVTKKLVERLGLGMEFSSRLNHGSCFKLIIPMTSEEAS